MPCNKGASHMIVGGAAAGLSPWLAAGVGESAQSRGQAGVNPDPAVEPEASWPPAGSCFLLLVALKRKPPALSPSHARPAMPHPPSACLQRQPGSQGKTNWHKT